MIEWEEELVASEKEIDDIVNMLDGKTASGISRIRVITSDDFQKGEIASVSHHGRCDVGSPWAKGTVKNEKAIDADDATC